jgi:Tol biopolymer transport system component
LLRVDGLVDIAECLGADREPDGGRLGEQVADNPSVEPSIAVLDGEPWIVYVGYQPGKQTKDLFLVRADGADAHVIVTEVPGVHAAPSWSPDGSRIAFINRDEATLSGSIWIANADGSAPAMLTDGGGACPDGIFHPNWSPDGSKLAVICYPDPGGTQGSVATYDLATMRVTRLNTLTEPEHLDNAPSWSPDGTSLAFAVQHWDPTGQFLDGSLVATISVKGGPEHRLTTFDTFMSAPDWSPDGSELVMNSYDLGNMHTSSHPSNVYTIKPDGTEMRQITHSSVDPSMRIAQPRWTPDGIRILVSIGVAPPGSNTVEDVQLALVDATDQAGAEPVLFSPTIHGQVPDLRPTP